MTRTFLAAALMALTAATIPAGPAAAADFVDGAYASGACAKPGVLNSISHRFGARASGYLKQHLGITNIRDIRQDRLEPRTDMRRVEREYCKASLTLTDGSQRPVWYLIERNWGFVGIGPSVEFCVGGLDPWYVYGANCQSLR